MKTPADVMTSLASSLAHANRAALAADPAAEKLIDALTRLSKEAMILRWELLCLRNPSRIKPWTQEEIDLLRGEP